MNEIVKPAVMLCLITAAAIACLALMNEATKGPIAEQERMAEEAAMQTVLSDADSFSEELDLSDLPADSTISKAVEGFSNGEPAGYVITVNPKGFSGAIRLLVGILEDGTLQGIEILSHSETPGLGANADNDEFKSQFTQNTGLLSVAKTASGGENEIAAITGATITTKAVTDGVNEAIDWISNLNTGGGK